MIALLPGMILLHKPMKISSSRYGFGLAVLLICLVPFYRSVTSQEPGKVAPADGAKLYAERCAACHDNAQGRTPPRSLLAQRAPEEVIASLTTGSMKSQAAGLSEQEIRTLAVHLTGREPAGTIDLERLTNRCKDQPVRPNLKARQWNGWGRDLNNSRHQPLPGLQAADVPRLKLKWAYAYPATMAIGQPVVIGERLFVTSDSGQVIALNARSGCTYWAFRVGAPVRTAVTVGTAGKGQSIVYFGDERANVFAIDAITGREIWRRRLDTHPVARITGSPVLYRNRLYVPVSSIEEAIARPDRYECCKFRGSIAALDSASGQLIWQTYSIPSPPQPYRKNTTGTQLYGPAGAAIWSAPTIDTRRGVLYVGTGNSYTDVESTGSDSIIAVELQTGKIRWANQVQPGDNFIMNCRQPGVGNCPKDAGPDYDFGSSPILHRLPDGRELLLAGQKSGILFALDPDRQGRKVWEARLSNGTALGGIEWGFTADNTNVYVPIADPIGAPNLRKPGLIAVRIATGEEIWRTPAPVVSCSWGKSRCTNGQSAAASSIPGVIFSGTTDGHLRAYAAGDGRIIWDVDTAARPWEAVNGGFAKGGSIDAGGPVIVDGTVYINSGYGRIFGSPGNALLAFSVE